MPKLRGVEGVSQPLYNQAIYSKTWEQFSKGKERIQAYLGGELWFDLAQLDEY